MSDTNEELVDRVCNTCTHMQCRNEQNSNRRVYYCKYVPEIKKPRKHTCKHWRSRDENTKD